MTTATIETRGTEDAPVWAEDGIGARALDRVRRTYRVEPGPLPPLGAPADIGLRGCDLIPRAIRARVDASRRPQYMGPPLPDGSVLDGERLGAAILDAMRRTVEEFGRVAIGDALGEHAVLAGQADAASSRYDERMMRVVGELGSIEARLVRAYSGLPPQVAAYWPVPPGVASKRLHARRLELLDQLNGAFAAGHYSAGIAAVDGIVARVAPVPTLAETAVAGWMKAAYAIRGGGGFPDGFAGAWSEVIPAACESYDGWGVLAPYVVRVI